MSYLSIIDDYDMGFRSQAEENAFKEGCRHGYEKAMKEVHGDVGQRDYMGYRDNYGNQQGQGMAGERRFPGYFPEGPYMGYREKDEMDERRRRDSRGRYM